ncbi:MULTISPECIES: nucleoside triphosphate pyrophosphatase [unclassified Sphingomonas]|uniref:Maf family protein n=1 Tax=unclassified Sphingomonas TaxID=196159 RepID=UPI000929AB2E|nr:MULTISPECIES: nucleoside triphosphate pyrophosphatase [unclassified Sphingomonas]OJU15583.1 MAG: septum formation protein Maf [Sphingomonas sp. 66-10]
MAAGPALVLASASPRRRDLLARIGVAPARIVAPDIDETPLRNERPRDYVRRVAAAKAAAVERAPGEVILAADTTIAVGRRILGKPEDEADLRMMLGLLAGRRHHCLSAVAVIDAEGRLRERLSDTIVTFKPLSLAEIDDYVASGEGEGKAGGYAIQGRAETWVRRLAGSHSGVVGLPLYETGALLRAAGVILG